MISYLIGKPIVQGSGLSILVNGVGYRVAVAGRTFRKIQNQDEVELHIYTHIREDALDLYGFQEIQERDIFVKLISVSGVGPKTAINMYDQGVSALVTAVQNADVSFFSSIPRVGKKLAQKIIIELKSKLGSLKELELGPLSQQQQDVVEALSGLGFDESSIHKALQKVEVDKLPIEKAIKKAMKMMGSKI